MSEWKPIETAPKGKHILYFPPHPIGTGKRDMMPAMVQVEHHPVTYPRKPTHWMPLPSPPEAP